MAVALTLVPQASDIIVAATTDTTRAALNAVSDMASAVEANVPNGNVTDSRRYRRSIAECVDVSEWKQPYQRNGVLGLVFCSR